MLATASGDLAASQAPNGIEEPEPLAGLRRRGAIRPGALARLDLAAHLLVGALRARDLVDQRVPGQKPKIVMLPGMIPHLEQRVEAELLSALAVRQHPFSAREEGRLDLVLPQKINDTALIAGDFVGLLAQIERQRDELLARRQFHPADNPTLLDGRKCRQLAFRRREKRPRHTPLDSIPAAFDGQRIRRPARGRSLARLRRLRRRDGPAMMRSAKARGGMAMFCDFIMFSCGVHPRYAPVQANRLPTRISCSGTGPISFHSPLTYPCLR
jgi:hypothetical protein